MSLRNRLACQCLQEKHKDGFVTNSYNMVGQLYDSHGHKDNMLRVCLSVVENVPFCGVI